MSMYSTWYKNMLSVSFHNSWSRIFKMRQICALNFPFTPSFPEKGIRKRFGVWCLENNIDFPNAFGVSLMCFWIFFYVQLELKLSQILIVKMVNKKLDIIHVTYKLKLQCGHGCEFVGWSVNLILFISFSCLWWLLIFHGFITPPCKIVFHKKLVILHKVATFRLSFFVCQIKEPKIFIFHKMKWSKIKMEIYQKMSSLNKMQVP